MTKKHFEWAAAYVRRLENLEGNEKYVAECVFADLFSEFNERFRVEQFRAACRGQDYEAPTYSGRTITRRYSKAS